MLVFSYECLKTQDMRASIICLLFATHFIYLQKESFEWRLFFFSYSFEFDTMKIEMRAEWKHSTEKMYIYFLNTLTAWNLNTVELISKRKTSLTLVRSWHFFVLFRCSRGPRRKLWKFQEKNRHVVYYSHPPNTILNCEKKNMMNIFVSKWMLKKEVPTAIDVETTSFSVLRSSFPNYII